MIEASPPAGLGVLIVASWFPAVDDTTRGRFIADQASALLDTGRVRPVVASFEQFQLSGTADFRDRQAEAAERTIGEAIGGPEAFSRSGWMGDPRIPVARLPFAGGGGASAKPSFHRDHRAAALRAVGRRRAAGTWSVVHAHTAYPDGAAAALALDALGAPLIVTEHATFVGTQLADPVQRTGYIEATKRAARFVCVSRSLANEILAEIPDLEPKLVVIPNTVDIDAFRPAPLDERRPEELLYVGYLTERKGIATLLRALGEIRRVRPGATLRLIGRAAPPDAEATWRALADELGLSEAVTFDGPRSRAEVAEAMASASLLVHASERETFGVAAVEALASGLPVIATDTGPLREILGADPSPLGALVPINDAEAFAAATLAALDRRASFDPLALRGAVADRFGARSVANRLADLYDEVVAEARPRSRPAGTADPRAAATGRAAGAEVLDLDAVRVVGFDTKRLANMLRPVPREVLERLTVVTARGPETERLPAGIRTVREVQVAPDYGAPAMASRKRTPVARVVRALLHPRSVLLRRLTRGVREPRIGDAVRTGLAAALAGDFEGSSGPLPIVCVDGIDHLAAAPLVQAGRVRVYPGGVRWLADQAWSAGLGSGRLANEGRDGSVVPPQPAATLSGVAAEALAFESRPRGPG